MHSSIILSTAFTALALAQTSSVVVPVASVPAGQVQSTPISNPFTSFLTETNSLGVVTGQPSVITTQPTAVTTQPSVITSQTQAATFVPGQPGIPQGLNSTLIPVVSSSASLATASLSPSSNLSTSTVTSTGGSSSGAATSSGGGFSTSTASSSSSSSSSGSSSGAVAPRVAQAGLAMGVAGAIFVLFL